MALSLLFPLLLSAQNPFLKLKAGDWFKMQVILRPQGSLLADGHSVIDRGAEEMDKNQYDLRFVLVKHLANGNEQYQVTLERVKFKRRGNDGTWYGYDSFYPSYLQGNGDTLSRLIRTLEIDAAGKIIKFDHQQQTYPPINMSEIGPKKFIRSTVISFDPLPSFLFQNIVSYISREIKKANIRALNGSFNAELRNLIGWGNIQNDVSLLTIAASFPLPQNVVIKGRILNAFTTGNKPEIYTDQGIIKINADGTFEAKMLVTQPSPVLFIYGQNPLCAIKPFIKPGDTLIINADAKNYQDGSAAHGESTTSPFSESVSYAGSGASDALIDKQLTNLYTNQMQPFANRRASVVPVEEFMAYQEKGKKEFNALMDANKNTASKTALEYYNAEWMYLQAQAKLYFLFLKEYRYSPQSGAAFAGFPENYFTAIDDLPILTDDYANSDWYKSCVEWLHNYRSARLSIINGGQSGFLVDHASALASFKGYALYLALSNVLREALHKSSWQNSKMIKPYYLNFINNCGDSALTKPLIKQWERLQAWEPGKPSPVKNTVLTNGKMLNLEQFKGKNICLIVNYAAGEDLEQYRDFIKKHDPAKVQFVILQLKASAAYTIDKSFLNLPNVSYYEVDGSNKNMSWLDIEGGESSVLFFDKWLRVVDDVLDLGSKIIINSTTNKKEFDIHKLDNALKKAEATPRFSKVQKAKFYTVLGWSTCSILFSFVIGYFIYRNRLAKIKRDITLQKRIKELEIKAIRSQMNPHFIFNSLNSIQSLINNGQYKQANIYLEKFAVMMRKVLNNSEKTLVALSEELDAVMLYCQLEQLRFDFAFKLNVENGLNTNLIEIPGMLIQPLVENAIVHGLAQKGSSGNLEINIYTEAGYLKVAVTDNGPGFKDMIFSTESFGLKLVAERLAILKADASEAKMTISNHTDKTGVTVTLTLPDN
ncbi:sensor histidine kinase [Mucilaginibacter paludis]|nr:histidine kinase [Mucilaginibacter paludis]